MQKIHDLGGMDGFTLPKRDQGRVLAEEWERQVWGLAFSLNVPGLSLGGRRELEAIPPPLYLAMPYYARWLYIRERALLASGLVTAEELANPGGPVSIPVIQNFRPTAPEEVLSFLTQDASAELNLKVPALYSVGESVRVRNNYPLGHTRVPGYVRGRRGVIYTDRGVYPFPDDLPAGTPPRLQQLYTVRFPGPELWGLRGNPRDSVFVDLWEDHLEAPD